MNEPRIRTHDLAKRLNCHPSTIQRMAHRGEIPAMRVGRVLRFDPVAVEQALRLSRTVEKR